MVGNPRVRSAYAPQPWSRRLLSLLLTFALALSLTPLPAWGDEAGDALAGGSAVEAPAERATPGEAAATEPQAIRETAEAQPSEGVSGEAKAAEEADVEGASSEASDQPSDSSGAAGSATAAPATTSSDTSPSAPLVSSATSSNKRGSSSEGPVAPATAATGTTEAMAVPAAAALAAAPEQDDAGVYQLRTTDDVLWFFASAPSNVSVKLCGDFDMRGTSLAPKSSFSGTFDGDGHTLIIGLQLNDYGSNQGLFGTNSGTIKNLAISGSVNIPVSTSSSNYYEFGVLVGKNTGTIDGCTNRASITSGGGYVGGIAGRSTRSIVNCANYGTVTCTNTSSNGYAGGIAGYVSGGSITGCTSVGLVKSTKGSGGIVGGGSYSSRTTVKNCVTSKNLIPAKSGTTVIPYLIGSASTYVIGATGCSFYEVAVATLSLSGLPQTGATITGQAMGSEGIEASGTSFTWEASDTPEGPWTVAPGSNAGGTFTIPQNDSLVGKYLRASVTADKGSSAQSEPIGPIVKSDRLLVAEAQEALSIDTTTITEENIETIGTLELPSEGLNGAAITWASDNETVIGSDGALHLPDAVSAITVELTATLRIGAETATKTFSVMVHPAANPVAVATISAANGSPLPDPLLTGTTLAVTAQGDNGKTATDTTYQWQYAESPEAAAAGDWHDVAGATKATFAIPNSYTTDNPEAWNGWVVRAVVQGVNDSQAETTATEAITFSDYLSVKTDFELLKLHYSDTPKDIYEPCQVDLPSEGTHGTAITWSSTNEEIVSSATGEIALPLVNTVSNIWLRGAVSKGSTSPLTYSHCFNVHPIPVPLAGVRIEGVAETGQTLTASPYSTDLGTPTDVTYQWEYSSNGTSWSNISSYSGGTSATLSHSSSSTKFLRVTATGTDALGQAASFTSEAVPYTYLNANQLSLITVDKAPAVGATLTASAQYGSYGWSVTANQVVWQWLVSDSGEPGSFIVLENATSNIFTVPEELDGKILQVSARSQKGTYYQTIGQISVEPSAVQAARWALQDAVTNGWNIAPEPQRDTNINTLVKNKLSSCKSPLGIDISKVAVSTHSVKAVANGAFANISAADDNTNGALSYFFYNPSAFEPATLTKPLFYVGIFDVTLALSDGSQTVEWQIDPAIQLGWDTARIKSEILEPCAAAVGDTMFAPGETAAAVTQNLTLPTDCGIAARSSAASVASAIFSPFVTAQWTVPSLDQSYINDQGEILERPVNDRTINLKGTFTFNDGAPSPTTLSLSKTYPFTLKEEYWQPGDTAQESLQRRIDELYQLWNTQHTEPLTDLSAVTDDFALSNSSHLKLAFGAKDKWTFTAESSNPDVLSIDAYRVNIFRPLLGEPDAQVTLTVKVFERENPSVCATKVFEITVPALGRAEIEDEIALMEAAKAQFFSGIANGQSADAVTGDLASFEKVVWGESGALSWIRTHAEASATPGGLVWQLVTQGDIPDNNHYFQSSDEKAITHENMLVTRPAYDKTVTVRACLSSERFADYYEQERYRNDPVWGPLLGQLYRQPLEATFTVKGTVGAVDPDAGDEPTSPVVSLSVTGITPVTADGSYDAVAWIPLSECELREDESAWDVFERALQKAGYRYSYYGGFLDSITTPDGEQTLGTEQVGDGYGYWHFRVNGAESDKGVAAYFPVAGDRLELVYVPASGTATTPDIAVNPDAPGADWEADWASFGAGTGAAVAVDSALGSLPSRWTYGFAQGDYASWSEPVVTGGFVFFATGSRLLKLDAATGAVVAEAALADGTAYGCRPVYTKGLVVVPRNNGRLQALSALTLQTRWLTEALPAAEREAAGGTTIFYDQQGLSTLTVSGDYLYAFTAAADWSQTYEGWALCVNASTGAIRWMRQNADAGYYWSGAASVGDYLVVAGDDGVLRAVSAASTDGEPVATLALGAPVRSTVVTANGFAYVVTTNGTLHKVSVGANGALTQVGAVSFGDYSTSTPTFADGVLYVGGSHAHQGLLAAIDADALNVLATVTAADGAPLPGEVKSAPLLLRDENGVVALFTCNGAGGEWPNYTSGGGVYAYRLGNAEAQLVYDPPAGLHNYAMASVAYGGAGTFYYVNDSGTLFALDLSDQPLPQRPDDKPTNPETPGNPTKPENPVKPGTSNSTSTGNGQGSGSGAGSGIRPKGSTTSRAPFSTALSLGPARTEAAEETDAAVGATPATEAAETVADSPVPLTDVSDMNVNRMDADTGAPVGSEPDAASTNQVPAATLALLSTAGLAAALYLVLSARKRREEDGDHA